MKRRFSVCFNLENSVGRRKVIEDIDVPSEFKNGVVTLLVVSLFLNLLGALRACVDFCDPIEFSRFKMLFFTAMFAGLLTACSNEQSVILGPQQWQDLNFRVETRPSPLRVGMNEFIVIVSRGEYKPGVGLVVMLRVGDSGEWRQAIQDGFTGVYRRAVRVDDSATQSLSVHVRRAKSDNEDDETVLSFPLNQKRIVQ